MARDVVASIRAMMKSRFTTGSVLIGAAVLGLGAPRVSAEAAPEPLKILLDVDASDLPRNLVHAHLSIDLPPGRGETTDLFYVTWTPGNHSPSGPIENVVNIRITDCRGRPLEWDRDPARLERFTIRPPADCAAVEVHLSYIASQPNTLSRSSDTYGRPAFGALNWNTVMIYPGGATNQQITVHPALAIPMGWSLATGLGETLEDAPRHEGEKAQRPGAIWTRFEPATLAKVIDSPVLMGQFLNRIAIDAPGLPAHDLAISGPEPRLADCPTWLLEGLGKMAAQGAAIFAAEGQEPRFPRSRFVFLVMLDESLRFGLEHSESTFCAMAPRSFIEARKDEQRGGGGSMGILAHEYFHVWCGKLRAPDGVVMSDYHTPARTDLLWLYEGLTTYYDDLLLARSGLITDEEYRQRVLEAAIAMQQRTGRLWRSIEDTARSVRAVRLRGIAWNDMRQGAEYYGQAAMFWLEADAIIRRGTQNRASLDDFCRQFFDVPANPAGAQATCTRSDIIESLAAVYNGQDWDALVRERIEEPAQTLDMGPLLRLLGWRIEWADEQTALQKKLSEGSSGEVNLRESLGVRLSRDAEITDIVPGSPADEAGLAFGMKVMAVGGWAYSAERIRRAVKESKESGKIAMIVSFGERVEERTVEYSAGLRYPRLERHEGEPDVLSKISMPRALPAPRP